MCPVVWVSVYGVELWVWFVNTQQLQNRSPEGPKTRYTLLISSIILVFYIQDILYWAALHSERLGTTFSLYLFCVFSPLGYTHIYLYRALKKVSCKLNKATKKARAVCVRPSRIWNEEIVSRQI